MNAQMMILLYAVLLFVVIYFMMVVPGKKKNKKMQELKVGDEVLTMGGIIATVKERDGEILTVEIDPEKEICMKILVYSVSTIRK